MKKINRTDLVKLLIEEAQLTKKQALDFVAGLTDLICGVPKRNYTVLIPFIGTFSPSLVQPQACYNFQTKERMMSAPRLKTSFRSTKFMRNLIKEIINGK